MPPDQPVPGNGAKTLAAVQRYRYISTGGTPVADRKKLFALSIAIGGILLVVAAPPPEVPMAVDLLISGNGTQGGR